MDEELQALMDAADAERDDIEQGNGTDEGGTEGHGEHVADEHDISQDDDSSEQQHDDSEQQQDDEGDSDGVQDEEETNTKEEVGDTDGDDTASTDGDNNDDTDTFQPISVTINGSNVDISSKEELIQLATKGLKSGTIIPNSDSENDTFIKQGNLSKDDLKTMIEAKAGNPAAIAKIAEMGRVDLDDVDEDSAADYQPQFDIQRQSEVDVVAEEILSDEGHASAFKGIVSELPQDFVGNVASDPTKLKAFSNHIKSGLAQETIPLAYKEVALHGGTFFDAYAKIGKQLSDQKANTRPQTTIEKKPKMSKREEQMRRRANGSDKSTSSKGSITEADEIRDMSNEDFERMVLNSRRD